MVTCKVQFLDSEHSITATLTAPPHAGEYIWVSDGKGTHRLLYKVEHVVHAYNNSGIHLFVKAVPKEAAPFFKQWDD